MAVGGYTGGNGQYCDDLIPVNGLAGNIGCGDQGSCNSGSGYFSKSEEVTIVMPNFQMYGGALGGGGAYNLYAYWSFSSGGDGGVSGKGGIVKVSQNATIEAYNGNKYTNGSNVEYCPIYIQDGKLLEITTPLGFWTEQDNKYYSALFKTNINFETTWGKENIESGVGKLRDDSIDESLKLSYINPVTKSNQGIGSGAGYIELSNGTYEVDSKLN